MPALLMILSSLFLFTAAVTMPAPKFAPDVEAFLKFDHEVTGLPIPKERPRFVFKTRCELGALASDAPKVEDSKDCNAMEVRGATGGGVIFLQDNYTPGRDDYILVHELVHFMQWADQQYHPLGEPEAKAFPTDCPGLTEPEAYHAQDVFVAATGRGETSDPLSVMLYSIGCNEIH